ncbi:hypothetical protein DPMN_194515 [Dreissena polymorpha]|uniref:Uncharacterized protein n=1 Tax=Dreissena polymorpha TaxID=45954 RepID=A0A9D3Y6H6_DREPO|nr:hypothetical protein DPMN_194515 [Dreissena polymorpha]
MDWVESIVVCQEKVKFNLPDITRAHYKKAVEERTDIPFVCIPCEERVALQEDVSAEREEEVIDTQLDNDHVDPLNASVNYNEPEPEPH